MRLFTAIDIPDDVKESLASFVKRLKPLAAISWSPVHNFHITTKFVGEWPEKRLGELTSALDAIPPGGPIPVSVRGLGWFPNDRHPRVFWAGIETDQRLAALASATSKSAAGLGIAEEDRPFAPHLTLARIRTSVNLGPLREALATLPPSAAEFGSFEASEFYLYLSAGGKYTKLQSFRLT